MRLMVFGSPGSPLTGLVTLSGGGRRWDPAFRYLSRRVAGR